MKYYFIPLDQHPDYGYGMIGSTYHTAAKDLCSTENFREDWYSILPVNYLRRHSIELLLKSGIILFHKKFKINFESKNCDGEPKLRLNDGTWIILKTTHNIKDLYIYLNYLIEKHRDYLSKNTDTEWNFHSDFEKWINKISGYDSVSDYFRYPISKDTNKDKNKNIFRETTMQGIQKEIAQGKKTITLIVEDSNGDVKNIYSHNSDKATELFKILKNASDELDGFHVAVRMELFDGF